MELSDRHNEEKITIKRFDSEDSTQHSFKTIIKNLFTSSLPHVALVILFLFYAMVGASILKEIESQHLSESIKPQSSNLNYKKYYESYLNLKQNQIIQLDELSKLKQEFLFHKQFYSKYTNIVDDSLNFTDPNPNKVPNDNETITFMTQLYNKEKNLNIGNVIKTIAKHLIEFKASLKSDLDSNLRHLIAEYEKRQINMETKLNRLVDQHLSFINSKSTSTEESLEDKSEEIMRQKNKWDFSTSIYFTGSLLTTIGKTNILTLILTTWSIKIKILIRLWRHKPANSDWKDIHHVLHHNWCSIDTNTIIGLGLYFYLFSKIFLLLSSHSL